MQNLFRRHDLFHGDPMIYIFFIALIIITAGNFSFGQEQLIYPVESVNASELETFETFDLVLLGTEPVKRPSLEGEFEFQGDAYDGKPGFLVVGRQFGMKVEENAYVVPSTTLGWTWKKERGRVCIIQVGLRHPETNQTRYLGYGAGLLSESASADPTVEIFVERAMPRQWTRVERDLYDDIKNVLGWESAQVTSFYLSPWDGEPGLFADAGIHSLTATDTEHIRKQQELEFYSRVGSGEYIPLRLKDYGEKRTIKFETSFEQCAPGRNSPANEWSAFGTMGNKDFNAMGRNLRVRYPIFDLVFRLYEGDKEIKPGELNSFRLGLVNNRLPAIWGGWQYKGLVYKVSVMTVPKGQVPNFDLYKLEIQNPTGKPIASKLVAGVDGPPDMRLEDGVVRGLGDAPFILADEPRGRDLVFRDWGLCDKRARGYMCGAGPGKTETALTSRRLGLDGLPVVYRFKAKPGEKYTVYLADTVHLNGGYYLKNPKKSGDLVYEYKVEGANPKTLDYIDYFHQKPQPLCVGFEGVHDADGDGYIEVISGVAEKSLLKHSSLSAIYVFPDGTEINDVESVYSGAMNSRCIWHINVGVTPEQFWHNQYYDKSDVGFARLKLNYTEVIQPNQIKMYWLKVPPIHRRQPGSMGYVAHVFRDVLLGEAVPPFGMAKVKALKDVAPRSAEQQVVNYWEEFFAKTAQFNIPDPILNDIFLSRLATRAILDVKISEDVFYNAGSSFFYFDHAYRDLAYVIYALDLAGLHDRAERLLRVYCMDVKDVTEKGPVSFDGKPLQLGMREDGLWLTRPGQHDTQGQNIWALVQHYKLSGDRKWLKHTAYPYIKRGALWIVNSRRKHMKEVKNTEDPRYGLIEPGGMEVMEVGKGMHMYYMNGFAILGLREAADTAKSLGYMDDYKLFTDECFDLKKSLLKSFEQTFKRTSLYEGHLWFGVEPKGVGMYGFWAHNPLLWPCRAIDPHNPMLTATWRHLDYMTQTWGGGVHSDSPGSCWPYIGTDRAISYILRGEPEKTLDYFCAFTDSAGGTLSWGEGLENVRNVYAGDQPHLWADAQWISLFRHLFVFEDESTLMLTPALFRRWHQGGKQVKVTKLPTHFGDLDLDILADADEKRIDYRFTITPKGDQNKRPLEKIVLYPRLAGGCAIESVRIDGTTINSFGRDMVIIPKPRRGAEIRVEVNVEN